MATSNYKSSTPICAYSINSAGDVILTVTNLRTTTPVPTQYGLAFDGLTNGQSAVISSAALGTMIYATTYASTKAL